MTQRIQRHPFLALFDGADTNASTGRRAITSTTPLQALFLMNDPFVHGRRDGFAARLLREAGDDARADRAGVPAGVRSGADGRGARTAATEALAKMRAKLREAGWRRSVEARAWEAYARAVFMSSELVYVN